MGDGYNTSSGLFTCPVSGLYHVSASIISQDNNIHLHVIHNNKFIRDIKIEVIDNNFSYVSGVVNVRLTKSDTITLNIIRVPGRPNQTGLINIHSRSHLTIVRIAN